MKTYKTITEKDLPFIEGDEMRKVHEWRKADAWFKDGEWEYRRPVADVVMGDDGAAEKEARKFLERYFPEPVVEFDWDGLWLELPSWIKWVAMDESGVWHGFEDAVVIADKYSWTTFDGCEFHIPAKYSPPYFDGWRESLKQRPHTTKGGEG